ncbi:MAG: hypothetical protein M1816_000071 [Peltula sp. TS41687]|nr:MAG: hypothetical protein M1816_000071 [Peltula sp. TS41687]
MFSWSFRASLCIFCATVASAASSQKPLQQASKRGAGYSPGQAIPITCLNRTIDTGQHISDDKGQLQYIPFPTCNETGKPLELYFGVERETNCTIPFISDEFFHLLEFYVHNDAPLTCRILAQPLLTSGGAAAPAPQTSTSSSAEYIPLIFALSGTLQLSHLHISNNLNVLLHAAPRSTSPGVIDSATAYSTSPNARSTRVKIGDALPLRLSVRWYPTTTLPSGWAGVGGHLFLSTLVYCALCVCATAAACLAYFRGVEFPRKLRRYGAERIGGDGGAGAGGGMAGRGLGGYGYAMGLGNGGHAHGHGHGHGWRGVGKIE